MVVWVANVLKIKKQWIVAFAGRSGSGIELFIPGEFFGYTTQNGFFCKYFNIDNPAEKYELLQRITVSKDVMLGKPTVRGTRLTVEHIIKALAGGLTCEQLREDFRFLEEADVRACLLYASQLLEGEKVFPVAA